jgi:hypothetical protein
LDKKAKITDVLSAAMLRLKGFLINDKVRNIFARHNLPEHRYYYAEVTDRNTDRYSYYWVQMRIDYASLRYVDVARSEFVIEPDSIIKNPTEVSTTVEIQSIEDFNEIKKKLNDKETIRLSKIVLNQDFLKAPLDIFAIPYFSSSWIISEKLRDELIKAQITGITISELKNVS